MSLSDATAANLKTRGQGYKTIIEKGSVPQINAFIKKDSFGILSVIKFLLLR